MDTTKKNQVKFLELKMKLSETKNWLDGLSLLDSIGKKCELEDGAVETTEIEVEIAKAI